METEPQRSEADRSDRRLIEGIRRGNEEALQLLYRNYFGRVYGFALGRVGDPQLAQEIAADVFFEVWRGAERFRGGSLVSSWLFGIAHYRCLGALRKRRAAKRSQVVSTNVEYLHAVPDPSHGPDRIDSREELQMVMNEIEQLPESYRAVAEMALVDGLSHDEIAERLGIQPENVRTRVSRARATLRRRTGRES